MFQSIILSRYSSPNLIRCAGSRGRVQSGIQSVLVQYNPIEAADQANQGFAIKAHLRVKHVLHNAIATRLVLARIKLRGYGLGITNGTQRIVREDRRGTHHRLPDLQSANQFADQRNLFAGYVTRI